MNQRKIGDNMRSWLETAAGEPRLCLLLTFVLGASVWHMGRIALIGYAIALCLFWRNLQLGRRAAPGTCRRTIKLCLFWGGMKLASDMYLTVFPEYGAGTFLVEHVYPTEYSGPVEFLRYFFVWEGPFFQAVYRSGLLCARLLLLMFTAQALTALYSPRVLGLAFSWLLRPVLRHHAWKPALALTLMLQFLPIIHRAVEELRFAARVRVLPESGIAFWRTGFSRLVELLWQKTYAQAVAIASRGLDSSEAWSCSRPWDVKSVVWGGCVFFCVGVSFFFSM